MMTKKQEITPKEFKKLLSKSLKNLYNSLVKLLIANGVKESIVENLVATEMLETVTEMKEALRG